MEKKNEFLINKKYEKLILTETEVKYKHNQEFCLFYIIFGQSTHAHAFEQLKLIIGLCKRFQLM